MIPHVIPMRKKFKSFIYYYNKIIIESKNTLHTSLSYTLDTYPIAKSQNPKNRKPNYHEIFIIIIIMTRDVTANRR